MAMRMGLGTEVGMDGLHVSGEEAGFCKFAHLSQAKDLWHVGWDGVE